MKRLGQVVAILAAIVFLLIVYVVYTRTPSAQTIQDQNNQGVADLVARLKQAGVPVKNVSITKATPLDVTITLQSQSTNTSMSTDDMWFRILAIREATLSYQYGFRIASFTLTIVNDGGQTLSNASIFLDPNEPSQKLSVNPVKKLDNDLTRKLVIGQMDLQEMSLESLSVTSNNAALQNGQVLSATFQVDNVETANRVVPAFVMSLRPSLIKVNSNSASHVALARIKVHDANGKVLLDYIWDVDLDKATFYLAEGMESWYPKPLPTGTPIPSSVLTQQALPTPLTSTLQQEYPPPGPTPTSHPYP